MKRMPKVTKKQVSAMNVNDYVDEWRELLESVFRVFEKSINTCGAKILYAKKIDHCTTSIGTNEPQRKCEKVQMELLEDVYQAKTIIEVNKLMRQFRKGEIGLVFTSSMLHKLATMPKLKDKKKDIDIIKARHLFLQQQRRKGFRFEVDADVWGQVEEQRKAKKRASYYKLQ